MNTKEQELAYKLLEEANACSRVEPAKALLLLQAYNQLIQAAAARAKI